MGHTTLTFPETVSLPQLVEWNKLLWRPANELEIRVNFCNTRFFTPFAMMFIISQIENYKTRYKAAIIVLENYTYLTWPTKMGFFNALNSSVQGGRRLGGHESAMNLHTDDFIPITTLLTKDFKEEYGRGLIEINEAVDRRAGLLTRTLTHLGSGYVFDTVQYSLREVMRNVFEHSGSEVLRYCAQYWAKTSTVELIISDCGMGVHNSLIGNKSFATLKERDALHYACLPGVSGNQKAMRERASANPWRNSGYGLYMTSRLCRNDGNFLIISSNHALVLKLDDKKDFHVTNTRGTLIRLHLKLKRDQNLRANLAKYTEEGKGISEDIAGAQVLEASAASQMLRRDFQD